MDQIICITGLPGSGKSLSAEIFKKNGFRVIEMSSAVKHLMAEQKIKVDNKSLRNFSTELRRKYGKEVVAKLVSKNISSSASHKSRKILINGVRSLQEIKYFRKIFPHIIVIAITSPEQTRYKRIVKRSRPDDMQSFKDFMWREKKEISWGLKSAIEHADVIISNSSTKQALNASIKKFILKLSSMQKST
jgi:dephospho-CoA kinase